MTSAMIKYENWRSNPYIDDETKKELADIENNEIEINERFSLDIDFGTAGLRGIRGAGTNRINVYNIALATLGYGKVLLEKGDSVKARGIAVSYDTRICSYEYSEMVVKVLCELGIKTYLVFEGRPVPMLSYAIREYDCVGGIMITASHNPSKYNGFKVYGEDGCQLNPSDAKKVKNEMEKISNIFEFVNSLKSIDKLSKECAVIYLGEDLDQSYNDMLLSLAINGEIVKKHGDMKIVYSPLNGTGNKPVRRALGSLGFKDIIVVPEQENPDGNFPSVDVPNPELKETMELSINLAKKTEASLAIATDPDADRTGLCVRDHDGEYRLLSGNQIGILLMEYILSEKSKKGILPKNSFCVSTIVSTKLSRNICEDYGVKLYEVLTGFKFIGEKIKEHDEQGDEHFQFGFEESFGYLLGTKVRDKDAVVSSMILSEMAAVSLERGETLFDRLERIYDKYGYAAEKTISIICEGLEGKKNIDDTMTKLRKNLETSLDIAGIKVNSVNDYLTGTKYYSSFGDTIKIDLPSSNVLIYELEGNDWLAIRPSGTEPKLKLYFGFYSDDKNLANMRLSEVSSAVIDKMNYELKGE